MSQPRPLLLLKLKNGCWRKQKQLSGYTLGELAALAGLVTPENLKRDKGWIGVLLEIWLVPKRREVNLSKIFAAPGRGT